MTTSTQQTRPRIADRLRGRHLLVTGATGFLARVFVEKLLRCVPEVGGIHLLVRPRSDGTSSDDRLNKEVLGSSAFDRLRASLGPRFDTLCAEKMHVVSGDLAKERAGLSEDVYATLVKRIDIIVNCAATVTFDEQLDLALALNTEGPSRLIEIARDCGNAAFMQVSTCYVSGQRDGDVPEELTHPDALPNGESVDLDALLRELYAACDAASRNGEAVSPNGESRRRRLIDVGMEFARRHGWNDTYTFTKWLGEQRLSRERGDVPVVILRPAIIESSYEEPVPGWIDGLRMADPVMLAYGRGKVDEFPVDPDVAADIIPVDFVVNAMLATLPTPESPPGLEVYQVSSAVRNPLIYRDMQGYLFEAFRRRPMVDAAGDPIRPTGPVKMLSRDEFVRRWEKRLAQATRARRMTEGLKRSPVQRRRISAAIAQIEQLLYFARIYSPYTHLNCRFLDDKLRAVAERLHPDDRAQYPFAVEAVDWEDYIVNRHIPGLRKFVLGNARGGPSPLAAPPRDEWPDERQLRQGVRRAETIFDGFAHTAEICGEKIALQMSRGGRWVRYTYDEALEATGSIARRFAELELVKGDRVVICGENCPEWGLVYLAAMRAGLTAVPLDPQMPADEVLECAQFAEAKLICAGRTTIDAIHAATQPSGDAADESESAPAYTGPVVTMAEPFVPPAGVSRDEAPLPATVDKDDTASILFTSGTTVAPKAVPLTHANFLANARALLQLHPLTPGDSFLSVLPLYHAFEFTGGFLSPLLSGATISYVEQLKGPDVIAAMQATGTTIMLVVPRLLKLFHDAIQRKVQESGLLARGAFRVMHWLSACSGWRLGRLLFGKVHRQFGGRLRMFVSGASALPPELHTGFGRMGFVVCEGYGLTETAPVLTTNPPRGGKAGSVGPPLPGVELEIRNANHEGVGELWARGPNVMSGYVNNPEATAEVLRDGWFRTGDLCRRDDDGYYYIRGRLKDVIVTDAGKNVYPDEVEARYRDLPYVREMCVVGVPKPAGIGESVQVVIVPDVDNNPDLDVSTIERTIREVVAELAPTIPSHQRIEALHFWRTDLPKTSTLKAKRGEIRRRLLGGRPNEHRARAAGGGREATGGDGAAAPAFVRKLLVRLTNKPATSIHDDSNLMLDLGVDSLMKLQIISELESQFGLRCPDQAVAAVARVSDLDVLVGDRRPVTGAPRKTVLRRSREARPQATPSPNGQNGRTPLPLVPARWAARGGLTMFFRSYVRVRAEGLHNIPASGPFLLAANHASHLDAATVMAAVGPRRKVWTAAAQDYFFNTRLKRWVFGHLLDTIPFDRAAQGLQGLRRCLDALDDGDGVLFFPEGTRSTTGRIQPFKIGVALLAIESDVPVIPTRIDNTHALLPKGKRFVKPGDVQVTFGTPIVPSAWTGAKTIDDEYQRCRALTEEIQARTEALAASETPA